jgi:inosine-uridine nucleoside N-ribohydrolase
MRIELYEIIQSQRNDAENQLKRQKRFKMIKRLLSLAFGAAVCLMLTAHPACAEETKAGAPVKQKVILDSDMVALFDDGIAMMMLYRHPEIDLMGVVTVTGNSWANDGTAHLVRQLELISALDKAPTLAIGSHFPIRRAGFTKELLKKELADYGDVMDSYIGAQETDNPSSWQDAYKKIYKKDPPAVSIRNDGVDYLIEMAHKYPHQIKLVAIGPATNIAKAVEKDPEVASLFDEIIYMGGALWVKGNAHEAAEFNIWLDPESAKTAFRAPFDNQLFISLDVTDKTIMNRERFEAIRSHIKNPELLKLFNSSFIAQRFEKEKDFSWFVWDVIASAVTIDPSLITSMRTAYIDCVTVPGAQYGRTVPYNKDEAPEGTKPANIIIDIDQDRFWKMLYSSLESF